jgi:hypothetical protein
MLGNYMSLHLIECGGLLWYPSFHCHLSLGLVWSACCVLSGRLNETITHSVCWRRCCCDAFIYNLRFLRGGTFFKFKHFLLRPWQTVDIKFCCMRIGDFKTLCYRAASQTLIPGCNVLVVCYCDTWPAGLFVSCDMSLKH